MRSRHASGAPSVMTFDLKGSQYMAVVFVVITQQMAPQPTPTPKFVDTSVGGLIKNQKENN
jgi:hypothetical protein